MASVRVLRPDWAIALVADYAAVERLGTAAPRLSYDYHYQKSEVEEEAAEEGFALKVETVSFYPFLSSRVGRTAMSYNIMDKHIDFARKWDCGIWVSGVDMEYAFVPHVRRIGEDPPRGDATIALEILRRIDNGEQTPEQAVDYLREWFAPTEEENSNG